MFLIMGCLLTGVLAGFCLRKTNLSFLSPLTTWIIRVLLFLLGVEVGTNKQLVQNVLTLGYEALLLAVFSTLGSVVAAWILWKWISKHTVA